MKLEIFSNKNLLSASKHLRNTLLTLLRFHWLHSAWKLDVGRITEPYKKTKNKESFHVGRNIYREKHIFTTSDAIDFTVIVVAIADSIASFLPFNF